MVFRYSQAINILLNHDNILRWMCTYLTIITVKILNLKRKFSEALIIIIIFLISSNTDYFIARFRPY